MHPWVCYVVRIDSDQLLVKKKQPKRINPGKLDQHSGAIHEKTTCQLCNIVGGRGCPLGKASTPNVTGSRHHS